MKLHYARQETVTDGKDVDGKYRGERALYK